MLDPGPPPILPDDQEANEVPVMEPPDLADFYAAIKSEFACASTNFLADLEAFRGDPKESLTKLSARFDEVADPLIADKHMTSRHLALHFSRHLPPYIRKATVAEMNKADSKRRKKKEPMVSKEELMRMAREHEADLLEAEAEFRAAALTPPPRDNSEFKHLVPHKDTDGKRMEDRLTPRMEDRLGARTRKERGERSRAAETRACNACQKVGHLAVNCPTGSVQATSARSSCW